MLIKLMKHEFRATGRIMVPAFLLLILTALGARFSSSALIVADDTLMKLIGGLVIAAYFIVMVGVVLVCFALMVIRFYRNLMGDEGYLSWTLPVSVHQHIWSKLLVSVIWMVLCGAAVLLSLVLLLKDVDWLAFLHSVGLEQIMGQVFSVNVVSWGAATVLGLLLTCMVTFLMIYASIAIGCSFANSKLVWSIAMFFLIQIIISILSSILATVGLSPAMSPDPMAVTITHGAAQASRLFWFTMGKQLVLELIQFVLFYGLTAHFLSKRLNLE